MCRTLLGELYSLKKVHPLLVTMVIHIIVLLISVPTYVYYFSKHLVSTDIARLRFIISNKLAHLFSWLPDLLSSVLRL